MQDDNIQPGTAGYKASKSLFDRSGWLPDPEWASEWAHVDETPLYSAGFLLHKLKAAGLRDLKLEVDSDPGDDDRIGWMANVVLEPDTDDEWIYGCYGDTPEEALAWLADYLFEYGYLKAGS